MRTIDRRSPVRTRVAVAVLVAAFTSVASPARADKDVDRLQVQVTFLQTQIQDLKNAMELMRADLKRLNEVMAEQNATVRSTVLSRRQQDEAVQTALREISEQLSEIGNQVEQRAAAPVYTNPAPGPSVPAPGGEGVPPGTVAPPAVPVTNTAPAPRELYSQAYADYARGNYDLAIQEYEEYLRNYPDTDLADNAQYWIGECLYAKKQFGDAITAWDSLLRTYPASDKIPDARFKKGMALERLGRRREALIEYRYVVDRFPNSEAGRRAREKLNPQ
jgi:tol-pal system protein YbgF